MYVDDIDIVGRSKRDITATLNAIERESTKMGLAVNEGKTLYISTSRGVRRIDSQITADKYTFDTLKEFIYLGFAVTIKIMSVWRSNTGSHLPIGATMVSIAN